MSGPQNDLEDVLKERRLVSALSTTSASSASQGQEGASKPKFRAATKLSNPAPSVAQKHPVQRTPSHSSFSTPGFGKKKPVSLVATSNSPVIVSSTETTPVSAQQKRSSVMPTISKRTSPSTFHEDDPPSKRLRPSAELRIGNKENLFDESAHKDSAQEYRSVTLDYSRLFNMSVEDLISVKNKIVDLRIKLIDHRCSLDDDAGSKEVGAILREYDDLIQDKLLCIDALTSARRSSKAPILPPSKWAPVPQPAAPRPSLVAPPTPGPSSHSQASSLDRVDAFRYPPNERISAPFEPYDGPLPEEEPGIDESTDADTFDSQGPSRRAPIVLDSEQDSDDMLWDQFDDETGPIDSLPGLPVVSSSSAVPATASMPNGSSLTIVQPDPELTKRSYYQEVVDVRNKVFGIKSWRTNQLESICSVMDGNDTFVLMPTGGGKSLTFQLPAEVMHRRKRAVTLVVGPLIALMADQEQAMKKKGIEVIAFYGSKGADDDDKEQQQLNAKQRQDLERLYALMVDPQQGPAIVYATPEKIANSARFQRCLLHLHEKGKLFMIAVDEAHVIASWGRTFREDLTKLNWLRENLPGVPIMALTATASPQAKIDIVTRLNIGSCKHFEMSFNRPNLNYEIRPKASKPDDVLKDVVEYINSNHRGDSGIIYVRGREKVEEVAVRLQEMYGMSAQPFHSGLSQAQKDRFQRDWQDGKVKIIVATIAFGMGIDKEDVRFVIHYQLPSSLSGYYQETGRAGRDGKPSNCILYYAYRDVSWLYTIAREGGKDEATVEDAIDNARRVIQFCMNNTDCRRTQVLSYFGEEFPAERCNGKCDNCRDPAPITNEDITADAHKFIQLAQQIRRTGEHASRNMIIDCFLGKSTPITKKKGFEGCAAFGVAKGTDRGRAERLFDHLTVKGVFEPIFVKANRFSKYSNEYVQLTAKGEAFLRSKEKVMMKFKEPPPKARRTYSRKGANGQSTVPAKQRGQRKAAEIAEDPIEDDDFYEPYNFDFPDDMDGSAAPAGAVAAITNTRSAAQPGPSRIAVVDDDDDDDDVVIVDPPPSQQSRHPQRRLSRDDVIEQCYLDLRRRRDRIVSKQDIENDELLDDGALQYISAMMPEDVPELRMKLRDLEVDIDFVEPFLPSLMDVILKHRVNLPPLDGMRSKPSSKSYVGARPKPPSISQLHDAYEFRQGSTSKPSSRKRS